MNIVDTITSVTPFDWLVVGFIVATLILGYAQGDPPAPRDRLDRLSLLLAANLRDTLGSFLASNWIQWPREYNFSSGSGSVRRVERRLRDRRSDVLQARSDLPASPSSTRSPAPCWVSSRRSSSSAPIPSSTSFYRLPSVGIGEDQIQFLKDLNAAVNGSGTARVFRESLIPPFVSIVGPLLPSDIRSLFAVR